MTAAPAAALSLAVLGAPLAAQAWLDPQTESELDAAWFGTELLGLSDLDGDGLPELAVAEPPWFGQPGGSVFVLSGASEHVLLELLAPESCHYFGTALAELADLDGDGARELAGLDPR